MSGDVQPRNCKDKRRKRDYEEERPLMSVTRGASMDHTDNQTIHIHKETGTGGHWCARIIFFVVLAGLLGTIGLIIIEHRGTADVDSLVKASPWATTFEGWIDETSIFHEEKDESKKAIISHEDKNDHEYNDDDEGDSHDIHEKENESLENKTEEESVEELHNENDDEDDNECFELDEMVEEKETLLFQDKIITEEELNDDLELNKSDDDTLEDDEKSETEVNQYIDDSIDQQFDDVAIEKDKVDDSQDSEDDDESYSEENFNNDLEDFGALEEIEYGVQFMNNGNDYNKLNEEDIEDFDAISEVNEMDNDSAEPLEEIESEESEETINKIVHFEDEIKEELEEESTNVAMKFGIGIALIVTARYVLLRRWNNGNEEDLFNLSRRNTLVAPVHIKKIISKNENKKQLLKKEKQLYEDLRSTYKKIGCKNRSSFEDIFAEKNIKLRNSDKDYSKECIEDSEYTDDESYDEDEEFEDDEELENNEGDEEEDEEEEEEEEDEDEEDVEQDKEEEEEEEEEEKFQDINDSVLIEKLDKKYGKLSDLTLSKERHEIVDGVQNDEKESKNYERKDELFGKRRK